jgi:hypothetical protein
LFEIASNCLNLKTLNLNNCTEITDNGLIAIAEKCLKLKQLDCYCDKAYENENVTFSSLDEIIETIICDT